MCCGRLDDYWDHLWTKSSPKARNRYRYRYRLERSNDPTTQLSIAHKILHPILVMIFHKFKMLQYHMGTKLQQSPLNNGLQSLTVAVRYGNLRNRTEEAYRLNVQMKNKVRCVVVPYGPGGLRWHHMQLLDLQASRHARHAGAHRLSLPSGATSGASSNRNCGTVVHTKQKWTL